jgi:hypothetical protein
MGWHGEVIHSRQGVAAGGQDELRQVPHWASISSAEVDSRGHAAPPQGHTKAFELLLNLFDRNRTMRNPALVMPEDNLGTLRVAGRDAFGPEPAALDEGFGQKQGAKHEAELRRCPPRGTMPDGRATDACTSDTHATDKSRNSPVRPEQRKGRVSGGQQLRCADPRRPIQNEPSC